ncbi:MAG: hypothetical protein PHR65_08000, partial [Syntrophomonadaceae bacterium]|nr:hypothetical protein [Syntrophomonadaceae bacterium]
YITGENDKVTSVHYNDNSIIYGVASSGHNTYNYPLEMIGLSAASLIFLFLAVKIFERNPLERKGELLLFGNFKHAGQIFIALIYGTSKALIIAQSFLSFLGYFILYFLIVYIIIAIIFRILLYFGIGKPATEVHQK